MQRKGTVMIVDDDADIRELLKIFLEADGYHVRVAVDGLDAFDQLQSGVSPALILLDLMMPRMDGEQLLKLLRARGLLKAPVVIMSGHNVAQKKAIELGASSCLLKPFEFHDLLTTVHRFVPAAVA
jgi:CheY-like chemotaxis protein